MVRTLERREALGAMAAVAAAGLAGCSTSPPETDEQTSGYRDWLHEPGAIEFEEPGSDIADDADHYPFVGFDVSTFAEHESALDSNVYGQVESFVDYHVGPAGLAVGGVDWLVEGSIGGVAGCSRSKDDLAGALEDNGYLEEATYEEYTAYVPDQDGEPTSAIAVADDSVVSVGNVEAPVDAARGVIDTGAGETARYAEAREPMADLLDALTGTAMTYGETREPAEESRPEDGVFEGMVAGGSALAIDGDGADGEWAFVHQSADDVNVDAVQSWVDSQSDGPVAAFEDISVSQSDRTAVVTGSVSVGEAPLLWP